MLYIGNQLVKASFPYNKELYDPSAAELNKRHSDSAGGIVDSDRTVITGYIDITEVMKHDEPKLEIFLNSNFTSAHARITYYDSSKTYLSTGSGGYWRPGYEFTTTWLDSHHALLHLGLYNEAKLSFYNEICYVRIEAIVYNNPAIESDRNVFLSIKDHDGTVIVDYMMH